MSNKNIEMKDYLELISNKLRCNLITDKEAAVFLSIFIFKNSELSARDDINYLAGFQDAYGGTSGSPIDPPEGFGDINDVHDRLHELSKKNIK